MANYKSKFTGQQIDEKLTLVDSMILKSEKGKANGVATLESDGKIPSSQLPTAVDDILEYADKTKFPKVGETNKIYFDMSSGKLYRWSGTQYAEISSSLALGETSTTAYAGNKGKKNANDISLLQATTTAIQSQLDTTLTEQEVKLTLTTKLIDPTTYQQQDINFECFQNWGEWANSPNKPMDMTYANDGRDLVLINGMYIQRKLRDISTRQTITDEIREGAYYFESGVSN